MTFLTWLPARRTFLARAPSLMTVNFSPQTGNGGTGFRTDQASSAQELSRRLAWSRREFLRTGAGLALGGTLVHNGIALAGIPIKKRKVVVITFGGGARDQETFAPEGQEKIPRLVRELIPQSTFFTQVVNRGN